MKHLLFVVNHLGAFYSHRLPIALAALERGYLVTVIYGANDDAIGSHITPDGDLGSRINFLYIPISRSGKNLFLESISFFRLALSIYRINPSIVHLITLKPVLYGGIFSRFLRLDLVVYAIAGIGSNFNSSNFLVRSFVSFSLRFALGSSRKKVIFQNYSDLHLISRICKLESSSLALIPGSGVSLESFKYFPDSNIVPVVTMASRLLKDKGVMEFLESSRILFSRGLACKFVLAGNVDCNSNNSFTISEIERLCKDSFVEYIGYCPSTANLFASSSVVVLPSYYGEGLPRVLIEAAACGRPVVTTDMPGCRDAIIDQVTGILVEPRDSYALADAISSIVTNKSKSLSMCLAAREFAVSNFSIEDVVEQHLQIYESLS